MSETTQIFIVVCFNYRSIEAREKYNKFNTRPENESEEEKQQRLNDYKEWRKTPEYFDVWMKTSKGYFLTQQDAIDYIMDDPSWVAEGGYYTHLLIEKHYIGWEGCSFMEDDSEYWLGLKDGIYEKIERPECFSGTVCFA